MDLLPAVFLIGFMGSGKTTVGRELAAVMQCTFTDLDEAIEKLEGISVSQLFTQRGEGVFRSIESARLRQLPVSGVIATGGGTPCFSGNMSWMNAHGITVYLQASAPMLYERLHTAAGNRPLLEGKTGEDLLQWIHAKISEREAYYLQAHLILDAAVVTPAGLLEAIKRYHNNR